MRKYIFICTGLLVLSSGPVLAQPTVSHDRISEGVKKLKDENPKATIRLDPKTGLPQSIKGLERQTSTHGAAPGAIEKPNETVRKFFERNAAAFSLVEPKKEIRVVSEKPDPNFADRRVVRVEQSIKGVPVFGTQAVADVKPGLVMALTSSFVPRAEIENVNTTPSTRWYEGVRCAIDSHKEKLKDIKEHSLAILEQGGEITTSLQVFDPKVLKLPDGESKLAWLVRIGTSVILIDAHKCSLLYQYSDLRSARHRMTYDLESIYEPGHGILVFNETNPTNHSNNSDAKKAHQHIGKAYDYFFRILGRDSFDNDGAIINSDVRFDSEKNAYWDGTAKRMLYGPTWADALDIVGHEFAHGVVQHTANLIPRDEYGALDESFADIFGVAIERWFSTASNRNWTVGEMLSEGAVRVMSDPHQYGFARDRSFSLNEPYNYGQPDHWSEWVTPDDLICSSVGGDKGCVHFNSGIFNKAAYLAAQGGSHHGVAVEGIGLTKVARILYRALATKVKRTSTMSDAATSAVDSCTELVGQNGIRSRDCAQMEKSFNAVGLL